MSTKLPEPLPYEYVDELIDSEIEFEQFFDGRDDADGDAAPGDGRLHAAAPALGDGLAVDRDDG